MKNGALNEVFICLKRFLRLCLTRVVFFGNQNPESLNEALVKSPKDMLLFSKKARQVDYKPCTLKEYRESKPTGYVELGKLQPDLYTDELVAKVKG